MDLFLTILFILVSLLLIGVILLQKGRGGGLSGAFGGAGGHSAFGSRTGDMFTWVTVLLVGLFLLLGVVAVRYFRPAPQVAGQTAPAAEPNAAATNDAAETDDAAEGDLGGTDVQGTDEPGTDDPAPTPPEVVPPAPPAQ